MNQLEVRDLRVGLASGRGEVVRGVSFTVAAGEVFGLVGESGSGKTTVAHALLGHVRHGLQVQGGEVLLDGRNLLDLPKSGLRRVRGAEVSYVAQDPASALNPALRIETQLSEILQAHGGNNTAAERRARIAEVLAGARLEANPGLLRSYPHQLSGGQQQRVAIAMAFACRPRLIVLDEPTTGLDVTTQVHVLDTIRALCASFQAAALYVSHDLAVVGDLAHRVGVMYAGEMVEEGPSSQVFTCPGHPYTQRLLQAIPSPDAPVHLSGIEGAPPRPGGHPPGCPFAPRCHVAEPRCSEEAPSPTTLEGGNHLVRCVHAGTSAAVTLVRTATPNRQATGIQQTEIQETGLQETGVHETDLPEAAPLLAVRSLSAWYGPRQVLFDVDAAVGAARCVALVGESGSGKTTLSRCLVGLHPSWRGSVTLSGTPLAPRAGARSVDQLRRVQFVFQNPYNSLNPRKTIGETLDYSLRQFFPGTSESAREERISTALQEVSLDPGFALRYPRQLSGGERQRVAIARSLIAEPDLLICDEVTSALDVSVQATIVELLRGLQERSRLSLIFVTHNLALVRSVAHEVVVLQTGRVVEAGPVDAVLDHPQHPYTTQLVEDIPRVPVLSSAGPALAMSTNSLREAR